MFVKTVTDPLKARKEFLPVELTVNMAHEMRMGRGNVRPMRPEDLFSASNWLHLPKNFCRNDCYHNGKFLVLAQNIWVSMWVSN